MSQVGWQGDPEKVAVIIPTLNARAHVAAQLTALKDQGLPSSTYLVIDSASDDDTCERYAEFGAEVVKIERRNFNHGGTRRFATTLRPKADFLVMMTQDAIPASSDSIRKLLAVFDQPKVGMGYGRQLPRPQARAIERHARLMNYPPASNVRSVDDRRQLGIKTTFCSNSYACYRRKALEAVGNFPEDTYFAEDQIVAGKMLIEGWLIAYQADACAVHSHGYSIEEEFRRYFDVGVFHARNPWLLSAFGAAEGEGFRFLKSELRYLVRHDVLSLPSMMMRIAAKYGGYRFGRSEARLSLAAKTKLSMQPFYWRQKATAETKSR